MRFKYILDAYGNFAIFSESDVHRDMARGMHNTIVSAGFCRIEVGAGKPHGYEEVEVICFGESVSLGLKSRPEDGEIITKKINRDY